ncbi:MAG TPA: hypothetical protein VGF09_03375 [Solirubrobacterales bacterium]
MSAVVLVARIGAAHGARAAAAAVACAGSEVDRAGLLIDLGAHRAPRPALIATAAARELEERLAAHLPGVGVAARGRICHLALDGGEDALEGVGAALAIGRGTPAAVHLPPGRVQAALDGPIAASGALLRADLYEDRPLAALAVGHLVERGLRPAVMKRPLGWLAARRALAGALGPGLGEALPQPACRRLLAG